MNLSKIILAAVCAGGLGACATAQPQIKLKKEALEVDKNENFEFRVGY